MKNYKPLGKMKTILTEDSPDYDDNDFGGTRSQTKFTATGVHFIPAPNLANNSASNFANNFANNSPKNFAGNSANNSASNSAGNLAGNSAGNLAGNSAGNLTGSQATSSQNAIEGLLLTGLLKEVLTGDKTRQSIADNKLAKENQLAQEAEAARQRANPPKPVTTQASSNPTPRVMSKEEEWYPVSYAQKQKEKEEAEWVANNPNATAAELFYPSMRKTVSPVIPPEDQAASQPVMQPITPSVTRLLTNTSNSGKLLTEQAQKESASVNLPKTFHENNEEPYDAIASSKIIVQNAGQSANSPTTKYEVANQNKQIPGITLPLSKQKASEVAARDAGKATTILSVSQDMLREKLSPKNPNTVPNLQIKGNENSQNDKSPQSPSQGFYGNPKIDQESVNELTKEYRNFSKQLERQPNSSMNSLNYGFSSTQFGQSLGAKATKPQEDRTFYENILYEAGGILGDTVEAVALTVAASYLTPVGVGVVITAAAGIATALLYDTSKELWRQHNAGEEMDFSKAFAQPFEDGVTSGISAMAVKKMQPLLKLLDKVPHVQAAMMLKEMGDFATEFAASLSVKAAINKKPPTKEDVKEQVKGQGIGKAAETIVESDATSWLNPKSWGIDWSLTRGKDYYKKYNK